MIHLKYIEKHIKGGAYNGHDIIQGIKQSALENSKEFIIVSREGIDVSTFLKNVDDFKNKGIFISSHNSLNDDFGYIEDSPFIKINRKEKYPTWIKGTDIVFTHAAVINSIGYQVPTDMGYLYWINSIGKLSLPKGVLNYQISDNKANEKFTTQELYQFVKQHYKTRWTLLLLICHIIYEKRFPLYAFAKAQFYSKINCTLDISELQGIDSSSSEVDRKYEVIIPTLGRASYLKNVLLDFKNQTLLPEKIIIVEQNAEPKATTELLYIQDEEWPFRIEHIFTHQTGVCNARNLALSKTTEEWVMLFDDDARFTETIFSDIFRAINQAKTKVLNTAYLQESDIEIGHNFKQWESFGSGNAMVHRDVVNNCTFDMALEHGYGEDTDYGMQIRNAGYDVIYAPQIQIAHLKAPIGGFREPRIFPWSKEAIQPKPSPQIMYYRLKNTTKKQLRGYKLVLFFKFYKIQKNKNPLTYYRYFKKAWNKSLEWSQKLLIDE